MSVSNPRFQRGMDMEAGMWSGLPFEILEQVLAFVPVPDLCRYRAVCKAWDRLISNPGFAARHNAASMSYIVMTCSRRFRNSSKKNGGSQWCILDVCARRWYTVGYDKRYRFMHDKIMAMDGGLVCRYLETTAGVSVIVHHPITKSARVLPVVPHHVTSREYPELSLVVDAASAAFKVVLINHCVYGWETLEVRSLIQNDPLVRVYESTTNEWRSMRNPPWVNTGVNFIHESIMFQGWLYVLSGLKECVLRRYDSAADVWETLAAPIWIDFEYPELVVSDQRLFLVAWYCRRHNLALDRGLRDRQLLYKLFELNVRQMGWVPVFSHSRAKMVALFMDDAGDGESDYYRISVFGFGSYLLFMSTSSGKAISFDVASRTWDRDWPRNPLGPKLPDEYRSWFGKHMTLLLPSTRW